LAITDKVGMSRNDYLEVLAEGCNPFMETVSPQASPFMETVSPQASPFMETVLAKIETDSVNIGQQPHSELFPFKVTVLSEN
jgi:DNA-binding phage protein